MGFDPLHSLARGTVDFGAPQQNIHFVQAKGGSENVHWCHEGSNYELTGLAGNCGCSCQ